MTFRKLHLPKVYVPNRGHHDYSMAKRFGELIYLTEGVVNREDANHITRLCTAAMQNARSSDYIMISSLTIINSIASAIFANRFGRLNLLIWNSQLGEYYTRYIIIDTARESEDAA